MYCNRYRESCNADLLWSEPGAICVDPCHLVRGAVRLGPVGDALSQRVGATTLANLGNDSRHCCGIDGNIRPQPSCSHLGCDVAKPHQVAGCSAGGSLLLRTLGDREYRLQTPVCIEFFKSVVGKKSRYGRKAPVMRVVADPIAILVGETATAPPKRDRFHRFFGGPDCAGREGEFHLTRTNDPWISLPSLAYLSARRIAVFSLVA